MLSKFNRAVLYALVLSVACALLLGVARPALAEELTVGAGEGLEQAEGAPTVEGSGQDNNAVANDGVDVGQDNASDGNAAGQDVSVVTPTEGTTDGSGNEARNVNDGPIASTSLDGMDGNNDAEGPRTTPTLLASGAPLLGTGAEGEPSDEDKPVTIDLSKSTDASTCVDITPTGYSQGGD